MRWFVISRDGGCLNTGSNSNSNAVRRCAGWTARARTLPALPLPMCALRHWPLCIVCSVKARRRLVSGFWFLVSGFWLLASGFWLLASGFWLLASGFWLLASGFWLLASGPEH